LEEAIRSEDKTASKWWLKQVTAAMEIMAISLADAAARDSERTRKATRELRSVINGHSERIGDDGETILAEIGTRLK
jgi:CRISPR/Cas system CSM-associated protein Csm2 small subunit